MSSRLPCIAILAQIITTSRPDYDRSPLTHFPVSALAPRCVSSARHISAHVTFPLNTFSVELPFSARKRYKALTSIPQSFRSAGPGCLSDLIICHSPWGSLRPATGARVLFSASGPSHWPSPLPQSAERSHLLHSGLWKQHHVCKPFPYQTSPSQLENPKPSPGFVFSSTHHQLTLCCLFLLFSVHPHSNLRSLSAENLVCSAHCPIPIPRTVLDVY